MPWWINLVPFDSIFGKGVGALIRALIPVLIQAAPLFQRLKDSGQTQDAAAQVAVAIAAPYIETPKVDPISEKHLLPAALTIEEEMGINNRMGNEV